MKRSLAAGWRHLLLTADEDDYLSKRSRLGTSCNGAAEPAKYSVLNEEAKLIVLMVGKPARKTRVAGKLLRYLSWLGYNVKLFRSSNYRYKSVGQVRDDFFDPANKKAEEKMDRFNAQSLTDAISWLKKDGDIAIVDSANNTKEVRKKFVDMIHRELGDPSAYQHYQNTVTAEEEAPTLTYRLLWFESYCEKREIVESNFLSSDRKVREDYLDLTDEEALKVFWKKVAHFDKYYQGLSIEDDAEYASEVDCVKYNSFIKMIDFGATMILHHVQGFLETKLATFCSNIHTQRRAIILVRHGESVYNSEKRIGGDSALTARGIEFAKELGKWVKQQLQTNFRETNKKVAGSDKINIWTSNMKRTIQTGRYVDGPIISWNDLGELDSGICEGMTEREFEEKHYIEFTKRERDKLNYRYPQGESYVDVKVRLQNVIFELERQKEHVMVISHGAVLRCLYSYFMNIEPTATPTLPCKLHTVILLTPSLLGWEERRYALPPDLD